MSRLWTLIQAYLDAQGGTPAAALARKVSRDRGRDLSPQTLNSWKVRGSRPSAKDLRDLAAAINVEYEIVLAAVDADAGYTTNDELAAVLRYSNIPPEIQERLRRHVAAPLDDDEDTGQSRRRGNGST